MNVELSKQDEESKEMQEENKTEESRTGKDGNSSLAYTFLVLHVILRENKMYEKK
jgi:hypothetical protein